MIVDILKAKTDLAHLVDLVRQGQTVTIVKNNQPVADLVMHREQQVRKIGFLRGKIEIPDNFCDESDEVNSLFYGN